MTHAFPTRRSSDLLEPSAALTQHAASIVVLPFDNMGGGEEMDYFSNGMTEDIIAELSMYPSLKVISRTSSFTYKGKSVTARQVVGELGLRYVLYGSVRTHREEVWLTAQLIDYTED